MQRQGQEWKTPEEPWTKKAWMSKSQMKVMINCRDIILKHWVPHGQTITAAYYIEVLKTLWRAIARKWPELWANNSWLLHHDNATSTFGNRDSAVFGKNVHHCVGTLCLFSRFSIESLVFVPQDERSPQRSTFSVRGSHESGVWGGHEQHGRNRLSGGLPGKEIKKGKVHLSGRRVHWMVPWVIASTL